MDNDMIDISSNSKPKRTIMPIVKETGFKSLGTVVKVIAFVVAFVVLIAHILAAYFLFAFKPIFLIYCLAIVLLGLVVSLILLFLIYALGHSICQNNEILELLKK